ncbi:MAG: acetate--CoA ligase family protein, partial [Mariprofundaceae bacterium]|nr:acetate--CoA ligase family protein [Mariprofundaceae bacterium]
MNIHEYQAKAVLRAGGIAVPEGVAVTSVEEALAAAERLGGSIRVVKAQIHAGGRGKAGGVRLCRSQQEVREAAEALLGSKLVTKQTGEAGKVVHRLYVEQGLDIACEFYLSLLVDREAETVSFVVSPAGGMDIEGVAAETPEKILSVSVAPGGPDAAQCRAMADMLGLDGQGAEQFAGLAAKLHAVFVENDCSLLELNPLILTEAGDLLALDAKISVDDNALFRQPELAAMRDSLEEDPRETEAAQYGLNYIALDGSIGCMVNGAGLA